MLLAKAILIDDILNTGRTFAEASKSLNVKVQQRFMQFLVMVLFVEGAAEKLDNSPIKEILVTDSVVTKEKTPKNVQYITASGLIGDAIVRIHKRKPVSPLFAYNKRNKEKS